ncbi:YceK/YidQ family lipoprotein [Pseudomonas sp. AM4(2022)]|uniref:YceK/YidQ family lipoprotein n=1 Tax=Pseudomonas sp. AM4(2022) TaxID=2983408 RepID=UPI002E815877|nr:YceK/YidQ family lipoprotein [Pseudomonas sp. AM4(2022)]
MKHFKYSLLGVAAISISGCGSFAAVTMNGPFCPYQGVHLDLYVATNWNMIKGSAGFIIPLAIIDLPFSFVADTLTLGSALNASNGTAQCPREFN